MKNLITFVKTSVLGGLFVVVPVALLVFVLSDLADLLIMMTESAAREWPFDPFINRILIIALTIAELILICFMAGLIVRTSWGDKIQKKLENIPVYTMIRNLTRKLAGDTIKQFTPAQVDLYGAKSRVLGFIVEELPNNRVAVFVPSVPAATMGQLYILPNECVERLNASLSETLNSITQWGIGTKKLYKQVD